ncbi:hypothetical protein HNQ59_001654 [Chitinivorax tropicus]|uniref:DUF4410 domain-containing protein n=1 Tax=Chitinivorax tropicus TaxID=714531 RepID=A0A840MPE8_9PROT|nr:hypothetical protein [Chitinivorax tropicus]MBB5018366.1 hypothetical protein [Chitinivorax tropicus]
MKHILGLALVTCGMQALAADPVYLEVPVTYHPDAGVVRKVREECKIEDQLAEHVGKILAKVNKSDKGTIEASADQTGKQILRLQITHVLGVGGGAWSGPKAVTVQAALLEDGKVKRETKINRWSIGGMWAGFKGTCTIIDRCSVALAKDLGRWARDPNYVIKEEAPPKDAPQEEPTSANPT